VADERIDIEINDKIDPSIAKKLREIKTSADQGSLSVKKLKADLATVNATPVKTLAAETQTATGAINKQLAAQNTLTTANTRSDAANVKAAASAGKNAAAIDAEAAAQTRLAAVIDRTIARQKAQQAANGATALGSGEAQLVGSRAAFAAQAAAINAASKEVQAATLATEAVTVGSFGRIKNAAMNMYDFLRDAGYAQAARFRGFFGAGGAATIEKEAVAIGKLGTHAKGSSTAIRELFVLAREAGRGDFTRMAGSVSILAGALGLMNTVLIPAALLIGTLAAGMKLFEESIRGKADPVLKAYANTLGLTSKEMRKLSDDTVDAKGKLHEMNVITLTFGDVWEGLKTTIANSLDLDPALKQMKTAVYDAAVEIATALGDAAAEIYATFRTVYDLVTGAWSKFPLTLKGFFEAAANAGIDIFEQLVNSVIDDLNVIDRNIHKVFGGKSSPTAHIKLARITGHDVEPWETDLAAVAKRSSKRYYDEFKKGEATFLKDWRANSIQAGKDRLKALADAIKGNRNPHKTADPKTKDDYLNDTNKKLDDELSRMHLLKDAREEQQRLDQIEEEFAKRRMPLTAAEISGFKAKIHAIQEFKYQQAEMDRIYEAATGPLRTYNAAQAAAKDLLDQHAISTARYSQELVKANRAYQEAVDPLFALKEAMEVNIIAATKYGDQVQANNYYETVRQQLLANGIVLSAQYVAGQNAEVDALMRKNAALQQQLFVQSQLSSILQPIMDEQKTLQNKQAMYDEIERLRQADLQHEQIYQRARYALDAKFTELRLAGARGFFATLAGLSSSGNKKLAAIGKAAAIATATIDGIVAVQKALASAPPPWNIIQAAAIAAMTGMNVAKILSTNAGGFANGGGFIVDGKAGVDQNNVQLQLSKGERVRVETPAQQRASDRRGGATSVTVNPKIVNVFDKRELLAVLDTQEGEDLILNVISRNPNKVGGMTGR
jgi:hypothetical protein